MKYIAADGTGSPFELQRNFAEVLIKAGLIREWVQPKQRGGHNLIWTICRAQVDGTPYIFGDCQFVEPPTEHGKPGKPCAPRFFFTGKYPEKATFRHDGQTETIPADICAEYLKRREAFFPADDVQPEASPIAPRV
jgi:hypothetical protein